MGYVINELLKLGKSQIGYAESPKGSNRTKYGNFVDTPIAKNGPYPWFYGKKNGSPWCAVGINWEYMMVLKPLLGSYDKVRVFLGYPKPAENYAAGCPYMFQYLKKKFGETPKNKGQAGDVIFFNTSSKCGHVGRIYEVSNGQYKTIEYNKGDKVAWGSYPINSTKIYGIIHIDFSSIEPKEEKPIETPAPAPTTPSAPTITEEKINALAKDVINGKYGNYPERKTKLNSLGYGDIYSKVQARVNEILKGNTSTAPVTVPVSTPKPSTAGEYKVTARGGLYLRKSPPANTDSSSGNLAGGKILCMGYNDIFVEIKRDKKWSYGTYKGKSGWACNLYLTKK